MKSQQIQIEQLKKVEEVSRIVVTSDSYGLLDMAKNAGVQTHKRAPEYCDESKKHLEKLYVMWLKMWKENIYFGQLVSHH